MGEEVESPTGVRSARQSWRQVIRQGSRRRRGRPLRIPRQSHRSGGWTLTLGPACNCRNHSILCTSGSVSDLNKSPRDNRRRGRLAKQVAGCPKTGRDDVGVPLAQGWGLRVIHHAAGIPGRPRTSGRVPAAVWIPNAMWPGRPLGQGIRPAGRLRVGRRRQGRALTPGTCRRATGDRKGRRWRPAASVLSGAGRPWSASVPSRTETRGHGDARRRQ